MPSQPNPLLNLDLLSLAIIVVRTFVVYLVLVGGIRVFGKREIGQMTAFDLVVVLTISNAVQNAMTGPDTSLTGGIVAAVTLLLANRLLNFLALNIPVLHSWVIGEPTLLVYDGRPIIDRIKREGVDPEELLMAAREHGVESLSDVREAVLEVDGSISVVPKEGEPFRAHRRRRPRPHR